MEKREYSAAGMALTKRFEGLRLAAYQDGGGVWTVGYGHTGPDVVAGRRVTEAEAEELLRADLRWAVEAVNAALTVAVTQGQFDALVDFCFNAGRGSFAGSTLLRKVNAGEFEAAVSEFGRWVRVGGAVEQGLVKRRAAEAAMFAEGDLETGSSVCPGAA